MVDRPAPAERSIADRLEFGVINLDKPPGPTSHQVVGWIKELLGVERAGHAGTLDPGVTGCLPVLLGNATRLTPALLEGAKEYVAVLELHEAGSERLEDVLSMFEGEIYQKPPRKSAVRRRLRTREIYAIDLLEQRERRALLRVRCESGTYIRKLCHDIGLVLGVGAHMGELRRTATPPFDDTDLVRMHELADAVARADGGDDTELARLIAPGERAVAHLPTVEIAPSAARAVATGAPVFAPGVIRADVDDPSDHPLVVCVTPDGVGICLGRLVGDPTADTGTAVSLERVLVDPNG